MNEDLQIGLLRHQINNLIMESGISATMAYLLLESMSTELKQLSHNAFMTAFDKYQQELIDKERKEKEQESESSPE